MQPYSPERRTALVLSGTGAHGAYHAGVLRALQEAGVKIDVMAGQGIGAGAAALAAIDGASRLWDPNGIWRHRGVSGLYGWTWPLRAAAWLVPLLAAACLAPLLVTIDDRFAVTVWLPVLVLGALGLVLAGGVMTDRWRGPFEASRRRSLVVARARRADRCRRRPRVLHQGDLRVDRGRPPCAGAPVRGSAGGRPRPAGVP